MYECHTTWRKKTFLPVWMHANRFWIATKSARFWSGWWLAMKNESLTTTWSANGRGRKAVRLPRRWPRLDWRPGTFFCVFGGIGRESCTMSCSPMAKRSIRTCTANNWTAWMQHSCRRGHLWSTEAELSSIRTTPGHTHLWWRARSCGSTDGRFFCIHRIVRISHQVITTYFIPGRTSLVVGSWPQESPVKIGSASFLTIGKRASIRGALWSWHLVGNSSSNKTAHIWLKSHYCNQFYEQLKIQ